MTDAEWIGLAGAAIIVGPWVWYSFKNLFTEIDQRIRSQDRSMRGSEDGPNLGMLEDFMAAFVGRVRFHFHIALPFVMFFALWAVFTLWAEQWLK